jgi:hypothetical protein
VASGGSHPCARAYLTIRRASVSGIIFPLRTVLNWPVFKLLSRHWYIKRSQNPACCCPIGSLKLRTGIRLAARTMAGAHSSEAAAPMNMLLRVIKPSWLETGAVIEPSCNGEGLARLCYVCRRNGHIPSRLRGNHLAAVWQVGEGASPSLDELFM